MSELPFYSTSTWVLGVFIASLVLYHVTLVWRWPLGKLAWKRIDYIWLLLALLGIIGATGAARQAVARNWAIVAERGVENATRDIGERIEFGTSGAVCRKFERSTLSSPSPRFESIQSQFDALCAWFREAKRHIPSGPVNERRPLTLSDFGPAPPQILDPWPVASLDTALIEYNKELAAYSIMSAAAERSGIEWLLALFGPSLLATGLALRITKVTAEIRLEQVTVE